MITSSAEGWNDDRLSRWLEWLPSARLQSAFANRVFAAQVDVLIFQLEEGLGHFQTLVRIDFFFELWKHVCFFLFDVVLNELG
jgi:hypothetical protein